MYSLNKKGEVNLMGEELIISEQDPGTVVIDNNNSNETSMEIIHVISIDFNYIMYPCIKLYQDLCHEKENASITWDIIENYRGVSKQFLQYDTRSYMKITKLIQTIMYKNSRCKLVGINYNADIIDNLSKEFDKGNKLDLINIDFYHDILYSKTDKNKVIRFGNYNANNWVGYLFAKNRIEDYTWIKAPNGQLYDHSLDGDTPIEFNIQTLDYLDKLMEIPEIWDYIFVNFPSYQVPFEYKHLYDLIFELFQRKE